MSNTKVNQTDSIQADSASANSTRATSPKASMIVVTSDEIAGRRVVETFGLVRCSTVRARHLGHDIIAAIKRLVGGEVDDYTKLLAEAREQAHDRLVEQARALGANAIVATRFASAEIAAGAAEVLIYGTAVRVE